MRSYAILSILSILFMGVTLLLPHIGQAAINTFDEVRKLDQAASRGIISNAPCSGVSVDGENKPTGLTCQLCHLVQLVDKLIYWMILFSFGAATFLFIYGGYHIMFFAASEHLYAEGKQIILGTVIGLVIVLTSWLLINTLFKVMSYKPSGSLPWDKVDCAGNPLGALPANRGTGYQINPRLTPASEQKTPKQANQDAMDYVYQQITQVAEQHGINPTLEGQTVHLYEGLSVSQQDAVFNRLTPEQMNWLYDVQKARENPIPAEIKIR